MAESPGRCERWTFVEPAIVAAVSTTIRFFDSHVHFWDPARSDWYPFLAPGARSSVTSLGAATAMKRRYDPATYRADAASVEIAGVVHVTATRGAGNYLAETAHIAGLHDVEGLPNALVGGFNPDAPLSVIEAELDEQAEVALFAGVRTMEPLDFSAAKTDAILRLVAERGLVFDAVTHPRGMAALARLIEANQEMTTVVEHTGWPLRTDPAHSAQWREGMRILAGSGPNVHCKLSGLAITLHTFDADALRPWLEYAIEVFGTDRCMFGSNFPVDAMFGDFAAMIGSYEAITAPLGAAAQSRLFNDNARAVYTC